MWETCLSPALFCVLVTLAHTQNITAISDESMVRACEMAPVLLKYAKAYEADPVLLHAIIAKESGWEESAVSRGGACGLMQVIPRFVPYSCAQLQDPIIGMRAGLDVWTYWKGVARGDKKTALACYNVGNGCNSVPRAAGYSHHVMSMYDRMKRLI